MKRFALATFVFCAGLLAIGEAQAEAPVMGAIVSATGADTTNGSTAAPFVIQPSARITLWCNAAAYICTDTTTACSATTGMPVVALEKWPTALGKANLTTNRLTISSTNSAIVRIFGVAAVTCYLYPRYGTE